VPYGEMTAKNGSIPSRNKKEDLKEHRDRQTYRLSQRQKNNRLLR